MIKEEKNAVLTKRSFFPITFNVCKILMRGFMNLKEYLANINMTLRDFCKLVDCNYYYLSSVSRGTARAGKRLAKEVENMTDGRVRLRQEDENPVKNT
jgi:hypothetical protein